MDRIASRLANSLLTVASLPAGQAHLLAVHSTSVMPESVIAGPAKRGTRRVVVICRAFDAHPKLQSVQMEGRWREGNRIDVSNQAIFDRICSWSGDGVTLIGVPVCDPSIFALVVQRVPIG